MLTLRTTLRLLSLALMASISPAQSGGFAPGELIFFSGAFSAPTAPYKHPLLRIDPLTGAASVLADWPTIYFVDGGVAYDPFRDRLITLGDPFNGPPTPLPLWAVDAQGGVTDMGFPSRSFHAFAPAVGGRIYLLDAAISSTGPMLRYIDALDQEHVALEASGPAHYSFPFQSSTRHMIHDAGTNALFTAHQSSAGATCGTNTTVFVQKHPLSADGSRVVGPTTCNSFQVSIGGAVPVGLSRGPNGLQLTIDTNSYGTQPRVLDVDPVSLGITPYASIDYFGAPALGAGTYSTLRGEALVLDNLTDTLRAFGPGLGTSGTILPVPLPLSPTGTSGEQSLLLEIPVAACGTNNVALYCTPKTTSGGCVPAITTQGGPSWNAGSGFLVRCNSVEPVKPGILFYGTAGGQAVPFQGGFLCVKPPLWRLPGMNSGGSAACSGSYTVDFNAWIASQVDASLVSGTSVSAQFWFRDPTEPISGTGLSAAVSFTICDK